MISRYYTTTVNVSVHNSWDFKSIAIVMKNNLFPTQALFKFMFRVSMWQVHLFSLILYLYWMNEAWKSIWKRIVLLVWCLPFWKDTLKRCIHIWNEKFKEKYLSDSEYFYLWFYDLWFPFFCLILLIILNELLMILFRIKVFASMKMGLVLQGKLNESRFM